jgi:phosphohistidine swiveling domain-containing protein
VTTRGEFGRRQRIHAEILPLARAKDAGKFGTKAASLSRLTASGFPVPDAVVIPFSVYRRHHATPEAARAELTEALADIMRTGTRYCVRSSVNVEDGPEWSYAGQFETQLDLDSVEAVVDSITHIWSTAPRSASGGYAALLQGQQDKIEVAVVVQEMVHPVLAGVVFTRNPVNGMDEVIVETVPSSGVTLMQQGVTPSRWVWKWGRWKTESALADKPVVSEVVQGARRIAGMAGHPVDAEWAYDGERLYWLQYRSITALRGIDIYSNRIAREQLPGLIKPLVWSINIPLVCGAWKQIFLELLGRDAHSIEVERLAHPFCYRAYYNMGVVGDAFELLGMPRESTELMLGIDVPGDEPPRMMPGRRSIRYLPRMAVFLLRMFFFAHSIKRFLAKQWDSYKPHSPDLVGGLPAEALLERIDTLRRLNIAGAYHVILSQMLMGIYGGMLRRMLKKRNSEMDESLFAHAAVLTRDVEPRYHLARVAAGDLSMDAFLERFGHLSESGNDFSRPAWRERPDLARQMAATPGREETRETPKKVRFAEPMLRFVHCRAVAFRAWREKVNFCYTYGYGLFRPHFLRLGELMVGQGWLEDRDDVFLLSYDEIREAWDSGEGKALRGLVRERREEMGRCIDVVLPETIVGDALPAQAHIGEVTTLRGTGASPGLSSGPACVVTGLSEAHLVRPGDVLVIPYSDVSWTPLFSRVSAIVSEAGGLLSHCSIVAREHRIPAVVSVESAMRITPGTRLLVDGSSGTVTIVASETYPIESPE